MLINGRRIGPGEPCYIVADIGASHCQDFHVLTELVRSAKDAGVDAVKFQTYTADSLTIDCDRPEFVIQDGPWKGQTLYGLYQRTAMPMDWHADIVTLCQGIGMTWFSSPFSPALVRYLNDLNCPALKIASLEANDPQILSAAVATDKPLIISTGSVSIHDMQDVLDYIGRDRVCLLHCTSEYPCPPSQARLPLIPLIHRLHKCPVGFSDHTTGATISVAAVAMGACLVEKHICLPGRGEDASFALTPGEFADMVRQIRQTEDAMKQSKRPKPALRRSLFITEDLKKGDTLTLKNIRSIRPGHGVAPKFLKKVLGRYLTQDVQRGTPLSWSMIGDYDGRSS